MKKFWFVRFSGSVVTTDSVSPRVAVSGNAVFTFTRENPPPEPRLKTMAHELTGIIQKKLEAMRLPNNVGLIIDFFSEISEETANEFGLEKERADAFAFGPLSITEIRQ
jgi:hypothetical protein